MVVPHSDSAVLSLQPLPEGAREPLRVGREARPPGWVGIPDGAIPTKVQADASGGAVGCGCTGTIGGRNLLLMAELGVPI